MCLGIPAIPKKCIGKNVILTLEMLFKNGFGLKFRGTASHTQSAVEWPFCPNTQNWAGHPIARYAATHAL